MAALEDGRSAGGIAMALGGAMMVLGHGLLSIYPYLDFGLDSFGWSQLILRIAATSVPAVVVVAAAVLYLRDPRRFAGAWIAVLALGFADSASLVLTLAQEVLSSSGGFGIISQLPVEYWLSLAGGLIAVIGSLLVRAEVANAAVEPAAQP